MSVFAELKRRNVLRVGAAYIVTAWLVIQVVETLFPIYGLSDAAVRIVVNVLGIGLVPVLVLSWVFEWTPEGLKKEADVDHARPAAVDAARRLDHVILVVLALALGYFAFDKFVLTPQRVAQDLAEAREEGRSEALAESYGSHSIAVLAFKDMSPGQDQEYLSDGLAEEILNLLGQIPELRVISRSSAFSFKGKDVPVPQIARELNVAHVLEGSVRKAGDRIRVTAQLIDGRTDTHLWSQTWDRTLDDIFAIQDEIAASMVEQMEMALLDDAPRSRRVDPDAYFLYLQGDHYVSRFQSEQAVQLFKRALEIQADYVEAWMGLSRAYYQMRESNAEEDPHIQLSRESLEQARAIDPRHPGVLSYTAWNTMAAGDYATAALQYQEALDLDPNQWDVVRPAMIFASVIRRYDIAVVLGNRAIETDPFCVSCNYMLAGSLLRAGRYSEAETEIERFRRIATNGGGEITLAKARLLQGNLAGAAEMFASREQPAEVEYGKLLVGIFGDEEGLDEQIARFEDQYGQEAEILMLEIVAAAGRIDQAFEILESVAKQVEAFQLAQVLASPFLDRLHHDPRWQELEKQAGVTAEQLAAIRFSPKLIATAPSGGKEPE